ncbi:MAG: hypothetical protein J1E81_06035 [Eubacterium sp.]|nr:hypothetical protein [Eubacterium sp.]
MNVLEIFEILKDKEYHVDDNLIFFNNYEFEQLTQITKGYDFTENELNLYFKGEYFCVELDELLDHTWLEDEEKEMLKKQLKEKQA